jgi:adenylate kinase family enzyme
MQEQDVIRFIGATGLPGVGKGEFVENLQAILHKMGIETYRFSLSEALRDTVRKQGLTIERPVLHRVANELRAAHGAGILATMVIDMIADRLAEVDSQTKAVVIIDGIRTPDEVLTLRHRYQSRFTLVGLVAPLNMLVSRIVARRRADESADTISHEQAIREMLIKESGEGEPAHGHSIARCIEMADWRIQNIGTLNDLVVKTEDFIKQAVLISDNSIG